MRRGKEIAQGSHASMEFLMGEIRRKLSENEEIKIELNELEKTWIAGGMAKICLRVNSEEELLALHEKALRKGLKSALIQDSGRTEFGGRPTLTSCAIGPDRAETLDEITGDLTLY